MSEDIRVDMTENAGEQTAEESVEAQQPKTYTEEEFNARLDDLLAKKLARKEAKIRKEYEEKLSSYREAETVLNAGLGTSDIREATSNLRDFYEKKGVKIPTSQPSYSDDDVKVLAGVEAQKIIDLGFDEVVEEVDRLADKGLDKMTAREKLVFSKLADYRKTESEKKELAKIGVSEAALQDKDFLEFAADLNPNLSIKDKYQRFLKYRPKKEVETIGSMRNPADNGKGVKDFYTYEEAQKFTKADFDKNPALFKAVENSMHKW